MKRKEERFEELLSQYLGKNISISEETELMNLLIDPELEQRKAALLDEVYDKFPEYQMLEERADDIFSKILKQAESGTKSTKINKITWVRWIAAASIILIVGISAKFILPKFFNEDARQESAKTKIQEIKAPALNKATITLSNGQRVFLDNAVNGKLIRQDGVDLVKLADGKIAYSGFSNKELFNTLNNPRGSKVVDMLLADGSRVWLNTGSSITFPVSFNGNERKVVITGEAYFEVAKNVAKPFKVSVEGKCEVVVLGTHFNINSYSDESSIKTTLLEGSVKVSSLKSNKSLLIKPGQQAQLGENEELLLNKNANLDQVMAWKKGFVHFEDADLQLVLRQLARWYDIEIIYKGEIPNRKFAGEMQLDLNLSQILKILETNNIQFKLEEGRKLIIGK